VTTIDIDRQLARKARQLGNPMGYRKS